MNNYKYQPLIGLLNIDRKEIEGASVLNVLSYVEEKIESSPAGRTKDIALFLMIINILANANIPFYVKGGLVMQYYLGDHSRPTNDIDIVIPKDVDGFYNSVKSTLENYQGELSFKISGYIKSEAIDTYLYDSFSIFIKISSNGEDLGRVMLEGVYGDIFDEIEPVTYKGPDFIENGFTYKGVPIEFVFAEKVLAGTSELPRPYKHLVDAYSLSKVDININNLKKYLNLILKEENVARKKLGMNISKYQYVIKNDKAFTRNYFFAALQAGYSLDEETMISELNEYFKSLK